MSAFTSSSFCRYQLSAWQIVAEVSIALSRYFTNPMSAIGPRPMIRDIAKRIRGCGAVPEIECFDSGMVDEAFALAKEGLLDLPAHFDFVLGVPGAAVGALLALVALAACFAKPDYRTGVKGVAIFLAVAVLYFWFHSRHHLVAQAPEEESALLDEAQKELAH